MKFTPTAEQQDFVAALDALLTGADVVGTARAWAGDDPAGTAAGTSLWTRLAEQGVTALVVPEESGGMGAGPVELVLALEVLGRHAVPGPWVESAAYLATALPAGDRLTALAEGAIGTVAVQPWVPRAVDADVATQLYAVTDGTLGTAAPGDRHTGVDPSRRLFDLTAGEPVGGGTGGGNDLDRAFDLAVLGTAAQLLGLGERLLDDTVAYVKQRRQFGREIGSYQALKHRLADVRIALDFARPLLHGAAVVFDDSGAADRARDVSAAKVAAGDAAYLASRAALQLHGAVGYTLELDLSLWLLKVRALVTAWGTPAHHRARVLAAITDTAEPAGRH